LCFALRGRVAAVVDREVDRVTFTHHHLAKVRDIARRADSERAAVTVAATRHAGHVALRNERCKPGLGFAAARPFAALPVAAGMAAGASMPTRRISSLAVLSESPSMTHTLAIK